MSGVLFEHRADGLSVQKDTASVHAKKQTSNSMQIQTAHESHYLNMEFSHLIMTSDSYAPR